MSDPTERGMNATEFLDAFDPWAPGVELRPWMTFALALRHDFLVRREAALRAIEDWRDGGRLWIDAQDERERQDVAWDAFDADADRAESAWLWATP